MNAAIKRMSFGKEPMKVARLVMVAGCLIVATSARAQVREPLDSAAILKAVYDLGNSGRLSDSSFYTESSLKTFFRADSISSFELKDGVQDFLTLHPADLNSSNPNLPARVEIRIYRSGWNARDRRVDLSINFVGDNLAATRQVTAALGSGWSEDEAAEIEQFRSISMEPPNRAPTLPQRIIHYSCRRRTGARSCVLQLDFGGNDGLYAATLKASFIRPELDNKR